MASFRRLFTAAVPAVFAGCWAYLFVSSLVTPMPDYGVPEPIHLLARVFAGIFTSFVLYMLGLFIIIPICMITLPIVIGLALLLDRATAEETAARLGFIWAISGAAAAMMLAFASRHVFGFDLKAWLAGNAAAGATAMTIMWMVVRRGREHSRQS